MKIPARTPSNIKGYGIAGASWADYSKKNKAIPPEVIKIANALEDIKIIHTGYYNLFGFLGTSIESKPYIDIVSIDKREIPLYGYSQSFVLKYQGESTIVDKPAPSTIQNITNDLETDKIKITPLTEFNEIIVNIK